MLGFGYSGLMTAFGQALFSQKANGSLLKHDGKVIGSKLIAQKIEGDDWFWARPSAGDYATVASGASNYAKGSKHWRENYLKFSEQMPNGVTGEMLSTSASGLDPHISPQSALSQLDRISKSSGVDRSRLEEIVRSHIEKPFLSIWGSERVNVNLLNLALLEERN